jgi:hypothetical protein
MAEQVYDWKRFWCPRSSQINLGDRGYLTDPESEYGKYANPELVGLEAIAEVPCLVLLGEPGIGKSQELINLKDHTAKNLDSGNEILELNLRSCTSLKEDLLRDEQFIAWKDGTYRLYLFLDSLDEGLLQIQTLATQLVDTFKKSQYRNKLNCLYLRIACRTAVFPNILEEGLKELWQESNVGIYELAPLRRIDVQASVTAHGLDANTFLNEVNRKSVVPFAIKPITLRFLLNTFQKNNGQFPADRKLVDLYLDGCRSLCEEQNQSRRGSRQIGKLDVTQRLIVAARIATVTVFANRFAVWTELDSGNVPREDVLLEELCLVDEIANERRFPVTKDAIEEVLDTGLFSSRGSGRIGWAHQTYAEFLAAWYLKQRNLELSQVLNLIIHPDHRVVPQLKETSAWLASMIPEVFQEVIKTDPDVLLQSDVATASNPDKAILVESLLQAYDEERLAYPPSRSWKYQHLNHPELATQIQKYIVNENKKDSSRLMAIEIAEDCNLIDIQNDLLDVVFDSIQPYQVRVFAASTLVEIADEETKARLRSLVNSETEVDPEDELKGYALQAIYPNHFTTKEVLESLKSPRHRASGGTYQSFVSEDLGQRIPAMDLPIALKWLSQKSLKREELGYPFDYLSDAIIRRSWENFSSPESSQEFVQIVYLKLKSNEVLWDPEYGEDNSRLSCWDKLDLDEHKRHYLVQSVIEILSGSDGNPIVLLDSRTESQNSDDIGGIVFKKDCLWLIECLKDNLADHLQKIYAQLIYQTLDRQNGDYVSAVIEASQYSLALNTKFEDCLGSIELGSSLAEKAQSQYLRGQSWLSSFSNKSQEALIDPPPRQRVINLLEKIEAGQPELWWQLPTVMLLKPTSKSFNFSNRPDLTKFPGWIEAELDTRKRILETAKIYLKMGQPDTQKILNINHFSNVEFASYQALYLLFREESNFTPKIDNQTWLKWVSVVLKYTGLCRKGKTNDCYEKTILRKAYEANSNNFIEILAIFMAHANYQPRVFREHDIYRTAKNILNMPLIVSIFEKLRSQDLNAGLLEIILIDLFIYEFEEARVYAISFLALSALDSKEARAKALVAARILMEYIDDASWNTIWPLIQESHEFGRELFESVGWQSVSQGHIEQGLKEEYLADLYIFLAQQYPEIKQPKLDAQELKGIESQILEEFDSVRVWKNYIPQRLQERGTPEACDAFRKIIRELPKMADELQWRLLETEAAARRNTWKPPRSEDILQLIASQEPSNSELSNQLEKIDRRTQEMADEPKIDQSIHIKDSKINGVVSTGGGKIENKIDPSNAKKGADWKFWLPIAVTLIVTLISAAASGVFNDEIKKFLFNRNIYPQVEQKLEK